jgi:ADP-ribose pyrophosphatase YjhB (NUDIX family)
MILPHTLLSRIWKTLSGTLQWRLLWLFHAKFIIGVSAIVRNPDNHILLLKHKYWKRYGWGLPSGYAIRGESMPVAIQRELREEIGLDAAINSLFQLRSGFRLRLELTFVGSTESSISSPKSGEILEACFFAPDCLPEDILPAHRELIGLFQKRQATVTTLLRDAH